MLLNTKSKLKILDSSTIGEQSQFVNSAEEKCGIFAHSRTRTVCRVVIRVSQKTQKSEFCFATNPTGFHRLDEPPEKISAL